MAPIRTAIIGLSSSAKTSWASAAHLPYLLSSQGTTHYTIVALLNSSIASAEAAKKEFHLPATTKAYGDPRDLAEDDEIDLVVCCTRADVHYPTVEPSLRAGKAVFIEWPLVENLARAEALVGAAKNSLANSIIGLQGRVTPVTLRLKQILSSGVIGKVLSSHVFSFGALLPRDALPDGLHYFSERRFGGNAIVIENGHALDWVHEVLGEYESFSSEMQIQHKEVKLLGVNGQVKERAATDVPDLLSLHGKLKEREGPGGVAKGALFTHVFRHGPPFKGQPGFTWTISGEKGELLVTMGEQYLFLIDPIKIQLHDHATDEVTELKWDWQDWQKELPIRARCVAELYERYAEWVEGGKNEVTRGREWPTLEDALVRMKQFDTVFRQYDATG